MKKKPLPKKMATSKNLHSTAMKNKFPSKDEPDTTLKNQVDTYTQHKFTDRTLQIFLEEMRLAMKHENSDEVNILTYSRFLIGFWLTFFLEGLQFLKN